MKKEFEVGDIVTIQSADFIKKNSMRSPGGYTKINWALDILSFNTFMFKFCDQRAVITERHPGMVGNYRYKIDITNNCSWLAEMFVESCVKPVQPLKEDFRYNEELL